MSRIGKRPIEIPQGVEVHLQEGRVTVQGPKGELVRELPTEVVVAQEGNQLVVSPERDAQQNVSQRARERWGLVRTLLANMVQGVTEGYVKKLELEGVGYRASLEGDALVLNVGYSHPVSISPPPGISFQVEKNSVSVAGINKELVGQVASRVRAARPPEPYKGKGIRYEGEVIRRKEGKKAAGTGG